MKKLSKITEGILGDMARRDLSGGTRKEDRITDKDNLIEKIKEEYKKQNSETTHKLDLTMLDVSLVEDISRLFETYYDLQFIDVSNWDVSKVESMNSMFEGCRNINIIDVSNWNVSNVLYMSNMFEDCSSLESIDVSNWNVSNVESMFSMFCGCKFKYKKECNRLIRI